MENVQEPNDQRPEWLRGLAEKTWNLELVISGAATYLASFLPDLTDRAFYYFLDNINADQNLKNNALPVLAYGFAKLIAWILPLTFIVHFIMRAFWAGLVGLHTVYPAGIQYDRLPGYKGIAHKVYQEKYGTLADYISRLDKLCNVVFAFAFTIVLFGLGISVLYMVIFGLTHLFPLLFGEKISQGILVAAVVFIYALAIFQIAAQVYLKKMDTDRYPRLYKFTILVIATWPNVILPFIYKPVSYLTMTFSSNINKRRFYAIMGGMSLLMLGVFSLILVDTVVVTKHKNEYTFQSYFGKSQNKYTLISAHYDNTRTEHTRMAAVSIPSEIIEGPFLKIFVAYPKSLDATLEKLCAMPPLPENADKARGILIQDSLRADCFSKNLQLKINDTTYTNVGWLFNKHPLSGCVGLVTFVPTRGFISGQNQLIVQIPAAGRLDSLQTLDQVPFWFSGK